MRSLLDCKPNTILKSIEMYEHIKICIFLYYLYFQNVVTYRIYQLDSAEEKQLMPKIRQLLDQNNEELENQSADVKPAKNEPLGRSVLVKRIVPHSYVTGEYEYDPKLNTVFKPVARYEIPSPEEVHIKSLLKQIEKEKRDKDRYAKDLVVLVQEEEIKKDLLDQIEKYLGRNTKEQKRKKVKGIDILNGFGKDALTSLRQKGQNYDPFAYGTLPAEMIQSSSEEVVMKTVVPSYPYWDYWTYSKSISQDRCPENLIRVGNMCISKLGHRRSGSTNDPSRRSHHSKRRRSIRASRKKHLYGG